MFYSMRQTETRQQLLCYKSKLQAKFWTLQILKRPQVNNLAFTLPLLTIWPLVWYETKVTSACTWEPVVKVHAHSTSTCRMNFYLWKWKCWSRRVRLAPVSPVSVSLSLPACIGALHPVNRSGSILQSHTGAQTLLCHMRRRRGFKWLILQTGFPRL